MDLRLYDTKTSSLQNLVPIRDGKVGIYLCGPTVQGMPHIGHLRAATSFDVLIRWLRRYGREFAERYPKIAGRLLLSADGSQDPHVERLIEAFALLRRWNDGFRG